MPKSDADIQVELQNHKTNMNKHYNLAINYITKQIIPYLDGLLSSLGGQYEDDDNATNSEQEQELLAQLQLWTQLQKEIERCREHSNWLRPSNIYVVNNGTAEAFANNLSVALITICKSLPIRMWYENSIPVRNDAQIVSTITEYNRAAIKTNIAPRPRLTNAVLPAAAAAGYAGTLALATALTPVVGAIVASGPVGIGIAVGLIILGAACLAYFAYRNSGLPEIMRERKHMNDRKKMGETLSKIGSFYQPKSPSNPLPSAPRAGELENILRSSPVPAC